MAFAAIPTVRLRGRKLLERVRDEILAQPERLDMALWVDDGAEREVKPACGTVACIAGWTYLLTTKKPANHTTKAGHQNFITSIEDNELREHAETVLGLSYFSSADLFQVDSWPDEYRDAYQQASSAKERAYVVAARIERYLDEQWPPEKPKAKKKAA